jgi:isopenicillin N synthase-like dioxygenase
VLHATAPGLEIYAGDDVQPMLPGRDEIVIMPGSVLTALSGGKIPPLYHQVRNHGLDDRQSIMYFVNPEVEAPLFSWIDSADGTREDIREHVQNAPTMFGLPPVEAL